MVGTASFSVNLPPMRYVREYPVICSVGFVLMVIAIHQIPVYRLLEHAGMEAAMADLTDKIILNLLVTGIALYIIFAAGLTSSAGLHISRMQSPRVYLVLLPYLLIFTAGFSSLRLIPSADLYTVITAVFLLKSLTVGILEEVVFRGLIQSMILQRDIAAGKNILPGFITAAIIFGGAHIINLDDPHFSPGSVLSQIFAATCLGALFGAVLLRTRNIYPVIFIHFLISFSTLIGTLFPQYFPEKIAGAEESVSNMIASVIFTVLLFGSALLVALRLLKKINLR